MCAPESKLVGAPERFGTTEQEALKIVNALVHWLKHPTEQRRLAAIMAVDVVGYSRLDESGTLQRLREALSRPREVAVPLPAQ